MIVEIDRSLVEARGARVHRESNVLLDWCGNIGRQALLRMGHLEKIDVGQINAIRPRGPTRQGLNNPIVSPSDTFKGSGCGLRYGFQHPVPYATVFSL